MILKHDEQTLGEITSRTTAEAIRVSIRGKEFRFGVVSNAIDFALSGDARHLAYLSPKDRRNAEAMAREITDAIQG